jgi:hypothetical protein
VQHITTPVRNAAGTPGGFADPPPLSDDLDDIVAYMYAIGAPRRGGVARTSR